MALRIAPSSWRAGAAPVAATTSTHRSKLSANSVNFAKDFIATTSEFNVSPIVVFTREAKARNRSGNYGLLGQSGQIALRMIEAIEIPK